MECPANPDGIIGALFPMSRKRVLLVLGLLLAVAGGVYARRVFARSVLPIKLGILHSRTGAMAISEKSMIDAELLAVDEVNARGGILGRRVEAIVADGRSDWPTYAAEAERLIRDERVDVIVGCWTSASRKTVRPVMEKYDHLLIYPMAYEGLESLAQHHLHRRRAQPANHAGSEMEHRQPGPQILPGGLRLRLAA